MWLKKSGPAVNVLECKKDAKSLSECLAKKKVCHRNLAIRCGKRTESADFISNIRLENGFRREGRLEIRINGKWGTVCDEDFDENAAKVVCRELGLPTSNAKFYGSAYWGAGPRSMPIHDKMICSGADQNHLKKSYYIDKKNIN